MTLQKKVAERIYQAFCNAGPTAVDDLPTSFHFLTINIAPAKTRASTKPDKTMIAIVLKPIPWLLLAKIAVTGSPPALALGTPSTMSPYGEEGVPEAKLTSSNIMERVKKLLFQRNISLPG
ncbi:hypothetical protein YC2023_106069 [Brassica napus]